MYVPAETENTVEEKNNEFNFWTLEMVLISRSRLHISI